MQARTDGELLDAFERGEVAAFEALVRLHEASLLRHARSLLGEGRHSEDVVQEVFLRLVQSPPRIPLEARGDVRLERAHLSSWLHRVTRNCCNDVMRSEIRRKRREEAVALDDRADGGLSAVDGVDTREAVRRTLLGLPPDQREVLVLRLLSEKSYREIAAITGKKIGTVGWLVSTGLATLASKLSPLLDGRARCVRPAADPRRAGVAPLDYVQGELS